MCKDVFTAFFLIRIEFALYTHTHTHTHTLFLNKKSKNFGKQALSVFSQSSWKAIWGRNCFLYEI